MAGQPRHVASVWMRMLLAMWLLFASVSMAVAKPPESPEPQEVLVGLVAPITGPNRLVGEFMLRGGLLAQDEINAAGGILGRPVRLVVVDEGSSLDSSVKATRIVLAEKGLVAAVGSLFPDYVLGASEAVAAARVPFIATSASWEVRKANDHVLQTRTHDHFQISSLMEFAISRKNVRNPAVLFSANGPYPRLAEVVREHFAKRGIPISEDQLYSFSGGSSEMSNVLARLAAGQHDALITLLSPLAVPVFCERLSAAGIGAKNLPCFDATAYSPLGSLLNFGSCAEGWYGVVEWLPGGICARGAIFDQAYSAKFGARPELPAMAVHRTLKLLGTACEAAGSMEPAAVNEALKRLNPGCQAASTSTGGNNCLAIVKSVDDRLQRVTVMPAPLP